VYDLSLSRLEVGRDDFNLSRMNPLPVILTWELVWVISNELVCCLEIGEGSIDYLKSMDHCMLLIIGPVELILGEERAPDEKDLVMVSSGLCLHLLGQVSCPCFCLQ
jgi:hypothetical protein